LSDGQHFAGQNATGYSQHKREPEYKAQHVFAKATLEQILSREQTREAVGWQPKATDKLTPTM
jgi:hypothetical protein